jgi:hypothetical protein
MPAPRVPKRARNYGLSTRASLPTPVREVNDLGADALKWVMNVMMPLLVLTAVLAPGEKDRVAPGEWGGPRARLTVQKDGASLELDCAHGSLETLTLGEAGRFDVAGRFVREHGGPIRKDETQDARPARYQGSVQGQTLSLKVVLECGETIGPFELTLGGQARLIKCR